MLVGDDSASEVYVRNKRQACERVGIQSQMHRLSASTTQDELLDLDFAALLARHRSSGAAATIAVAQPTSPFGVVELDDDRVTGFAEGGTIESWVSCGVYVLSEEALARFPERGDHETTAFPELAAEGKLRAFRHEGLWLTVNTPKDLRRAEEYLGAHPEWLQA